jgi:hypothetical protein
MATVKAFSVARTADNAAASTVYSLGSGSPGFNGATGATPSTGRNQCYDHNSPQGLVEGRTPTLVVSGQSLTGLTAATPFSAQTTAGSASSVLSTSVVADTTTITGGGAGLRLRFTTTAAGAVPVVANVTAVDTGMGYADGDTVSIDGWPGSVYVVDAA